VDKHNLFLQQKFMLTAQVTKLDDLSMMNRAQTSKRSYCT